MFQNRCHWHSLKRETEGTLGFAPILVGMLLKGDGVPRKKRGACKKSLLHHKFEEGRAQGKEPDKLNGSLGGDSFPPRLSFIYSIWGNDLSERDGTLT